jgi:hypothetical protein
MRAIVGLLLVLTVQLCFAQQTNPAGLESLAANVLVWASSGRLNTTSVSSWYAFNGNTLSTATNAPTLLADQFNTNVPGVSFTSPQCLKSTTIGVTSFPYSIYVVARVPDDGVHVLTSQEVSASDGFVLLLSRNSTTMELSFYADGEVAASVSQESMIYTTGDPLIFWYTQDGSSYTIGFDIITKFVTSPSTPTFAGAVTTAIGCNINDDFLTGVIGEVLITNSTANNAAHNIILNNLAARYDVASIPKKVYTGSSDQNSNCDEDVSGIGSESNGNVRKGNSVQLTISRQTPLPNGDYVMFGRVPDDGDLFVYPYRVNFTSFSRAWFVTVTVGGQVDNVNATADVAFDISSVKDVMGANDPTYFLLYQPSGANAYEIISEEGVASGDGNTVTFSGATLYTGFLTVGSSARAPVAPQTPNSAPAAGPAAAPSTPSSAPTYAYPSPGIVRRSDAVGTTISVIGTLMLAASLLF